jgi:hypothetical protein
VAMTGICESVRTSPNSPPSAIYAIDSVSTVIWHQGTQVRMKSTTRPIALSDLHFDLENPRYGRRAGEATTEDKALDMIASDFLVDDLLSSIATNGFFEGEPLIVQSRKAGGYTVLEGNRRLSALLILANDPRAANQKRRGEVFRAKLAANSHEAPKEVPAVEIADAESAKQALAYLGTKHIVGARQWDSYAKAKWMGEMRDKTDLSLDQIKEMIGDTSGLVDRMLEGYYLVEQLREAGRFDVGQSYVRGRGSNPEFPFSWVYTALNLSGVRKFLHLTEKGEPKANPIAEDHLPDAGDLLEMMFGNRQRQKRPVIGESRDLAELSKALLDTAKSARLRDGVNLETVIEEGKPLTEQMSLLVSESIERLAKANGILSRGEIDVEQARALDTPTKQVWKASQSLRKGIKGILDAEEEEEDLE